MKIGQTKKAKGYLIRVNKLMKRGYFPFKPPYDLDLVHPVSRKPLLSWRVKRRNFKKFYFDEK